MLKGIRILPRPCNSVEVSSQNNNNGEPGKVVHTSDEVHDSELEGGGPQIPTDIGSQIVYNEDSDMGWTKVKVGRKIRRKGNERPVLEHQGARPSW